MGVIELRILFVTQYIDHILFFFLRTLATKTSLSVVFEFENEWTRKLAESGVRLDQIPVRSRFDRRFQVRIESLWSDGPWEVIQSFHGNAQLANLIQWNTRRIPIVGYRAYIGHLKFSENPVAYWSVRSPRLSAVVAVSSAVKEYLDAFRFLRPQNVSVISHGINRDWIKSQCDEPFGLRSKLGLEEDTFIVACMASLRPYKHFELITRAARQLETYSIHFVHVGDPKGWDKRASEIRNVHFLGHQAQPFSILSDADVFVSTSHNEAFGRSNLEAMALGKPLIGSNTGGLLDLIKEGVTGKFFETQNEHHFAHEVLSYYKDRRLIETHGENTIRRVEQEFSTLRMTERYMDVYQEVLGRST